MRSLGKVTNSDFKQLQITMTRMMMIIACLLCSEIGFKKKKVLLLLFQGQGEEKFLPCLRISNTWVEFHFSQLPVSRFDSYFLITQGWIQSSLSQPDSFHSSNADQTFLG